ncbi:MAG: hypothetical protein ACI82A_002517 [Candidatus Azotimanducaceae bacterium]|jgi:hypothetical protein
MRLRSVFLALSPLPAIPLLVYGWFAFYAVVSSVYEIHISSLPILLLVPLATVACLGIFLTAFDVMYSTRLKRALLETLVASGITLSIEALIFGGYGAIVRNEQIPFFVILVILLSGPLAGGCFARKVLHGSDA